MVKKCSNCGHENVTEDGNLNFCEACGHALKRDEDYEFNFGEDTPSSTQTPYYETQVNYQQPSQTVGVSTKYSAVQLNKRIRDLTTGVIVLAIFLFVRFISCLTAVGDIQSIQSDLKLMVDPYYNIEQEFIDVCQRFVDSAISQIVFGTFALVLILSMLVFLLLKRKNHFPTQNDCIFKEFNILKYMGIGLIVLLVVYTILEIVIVGVNIKIDEYANTEDESLFSIGFNMGAVIADVVALAISIFVVSNCNKIARSKA